MSINPEASSIPGGPQPSNAPPDSAEALVSGFFQDARARLQQNDWASVFTDMLNSNAATQAPAPRAVPPGLHPLGQLGAIFASTMAEQLGARGAVAAHQNRVANYEELQRQTEEANRQDAIRFEQQKHERELSIRMRINEAKAEQAKQMGNLDEYEARLKTGAAYRKEQARIAEESKLRIMQENNKQILDRIITAAKAKGEEARTTINYRVMLRELEQNKKASEPLKLWAANESKMIFARDGMTGEYIYTPEQQEQKAKELYDEYSSRLADELNPNKATTPDFFDQIFGD